METLQTDVSGGIALVTFNRPHVHNAVSLEMVEELQQTLSSYRTDDRIKVVVFTGAGKSFMSGGDLEQFLSVRGKEQAQPLLSKVGGLLEQIDTYPKPTIAMINGSAIGGGCEFAVSCHFRFASETAVLGFVQIGMHITTGWGGGSRLLSKLPESRALTLLLTGERVSAAEAEALGFLDGVSSQDQLQADVFAFAEKIAEKPLAGIQAYLRLLAWKRAGMDRAELLRREIGQCAQMWGSADHWAAASRYLRKS